MNEITGGNYIPGSSFFYQMSGTGKLICFFIILTAVILTDSCPGFGMILCFFCVMIYFSGLGFYVATESVGHLWRFFLIIFFMNAVFFEKGRTLWSWWIFHLSTGGIRQGIVVITRVVLLMILGNLLTATTTPIELTASIENLLCPLQMFRVPVRDVAMILGISLQFIPVFMEEATMIKRAQIARGARFESRRLTERAASILPLCIPVFLSAFRRADELALAMEARGYRRGRKIRKKPDRKLRRTDMTAFFVSLVLTGIQFIL